MKPAIAIPLREAIRTAGWAHLPAGDPADENGYLTLLRTLYETGRRDLPLGRLIEGHVDAVQIMLRYAAPGQIARLRDALGRGAMLGVWNAGLADAPLVLDDHRLRGGKSFASGAGVLTHAVVNAATPGGAQLVLVDLTRTPPVIDRDWWRVVGMQRSETHQVRWDNVPIDQDAVFGAPEDYVREPFFSGGALRFVAVHAGGIAGLFDCVRDHLVATGRRGDPFQAARLAELLTLADLAAGTIARTARTWFADPGENARLAWVAAARLTVLDAAQCAMIVAQDAVGLQGMFVDHPLSAILTDLAVYLRQPGPDSQRLRVGRAAADGTLRPGL